jgi:hypothetical protein
MQQQKNCWKWCFLYSLCKVIKQESWIDWDQSWDSCETAAS